MRISDWSSDVCSSDLPKARPFAGVELGGTKCICTLAHGPTHVLDQRTIPTTVPGETLPAIVATLTAWYRDPGFAALGIASFGPLDLAPRSPRYGHILATNKPGWSDADVLGERSEEHTSELQSLMRNSYAVVC